MYDTVVVIGGCKGKCMQDVEEAQKKTGFDSITKHNTRKKEGNGHKYTKEEISNALENVPGYLDYVAKHGHHFTEALAEDVSKGLKNANGSTHYWSCPSVKRVLTSELELDIPNNITLGDITYLANMYYSDFCPDYMIEGDCIQAAHSMASDPDGYEGMIFCRWVADVMGKKLEINWNKYI